MCELHRLHSFSLYVGACLKVSGEQLEYTVLCGPQACGIRLFTLTSWPSSRCQSRPVSSWIKLIKLCPIYAFTSTLLINPVNHAHNWQLGGTNQVRCFSIPTPTSDYDNDPELDDCNQGLLQIRMCRTLTEARGSPAYLGPEQQCSTGAV